MHQCSDLDFPQAVDTSNQLKVQEELMNFQFNNSEGPLWCARLLQQDSYGGSTSPGLEATFPYSRSLVLANHHGIADGTTNNRTVNFFLQILDDIIAGKPIDDSEQCGELASGEETISLLEATEHELKKNENLFKQTLEDLEKKHAKKKLVASAFPRLDDPNFTTKLVSETLDEETTTRFFQRCKQEGVTVNSGFSALINGSLVDLLSEAGLQLDEYPILQLYAINLRRYWQGDVSRALGCHISGMEKYNVLTQQWKDNFWQQVRDHHRNIHDDLKKLEPLKFLIYFLLGNGEERTKSMLKERPTPDNDQSFANIGNLDHLIPAEGEHVRLAHIVRSTQGWVDRLLHMFHSLRGRLMYNMCYTSDLLTDQEARRFTDLIFRNLKAMI